MKQRPPDSGFFLRKLKKTFNADEFRGTFNAIVDWGLVSVGWQPKEMDGHGKLLHISDTPSGIYGYLSRLLKRVNPSVVVHTGDLADDIKLELYPGEREHYRATVKKLLNILQAPHRKVVLSLGNHDERELLPCLSPDCVVCEDAREMAFQGASFRVSHYAEDLLEQPARFNLFGHGPETMSYEDDEGRCFLNGFEWIRLIDPRSGEIWHIKYPKSTAGARAMCSCMKRC